ncbi:MAG: hypothetical protein J6T29_03830 [Alphaproteobacteria bacterium]|nr:hypothetical protein [Alphaproteobacteria bacterium]
MRNILAIFLIFFCFDCCCDRAQLFDALENLKSGNFNTNEFVDSIANSFVGENNSLQNKDSRQSKVRNNSLKVKQPIKFMKREDVFPKEEIKKIEISPDGQRVVCLVRQGRNQYLKNISNANSSVVQVVKEEKYPINDFVLFGRNIVYTYYDEENILNVKAKYSTATARLLNLPSNLRSVRFFKNNSLCMAECYDGEEYTLYSIRYDTKTKKFLCRGEKRLSRPTQSLFNNNLNPVLTIKNENGLTNVYANLPMKTSLSKEGKDNGIDMSSNDFVESEEDELPNSEDLDDSEDSADNLIQVGQIQNPDSEKYFSVDNDNNWYTATLKNKGKLLVIERKKLSKGDELKVETRGIYSLKNVSSLSQVRINTNQNGGPSFVSVSNKKYQHFSWKANINIHLKIINNKFNYASWYRVNTSSDGKIWLIRVMSDKLKDQFFTYNTEKNKFTFIPTNSDNNRAYNVNDYSINKLNLRPMTCHYLKGAVKMFFARGGTTNSPLIVMTNALKQYDWKYMPTVQILANRGFNVLCLNCRKSEEDFTKALREMINSNIEQRDESHEDESDDDEENDGEKVKREELSPDELVKSKRIVKESVDKAVADIKEAINWAVKNRLAKYGNIILFAENHSIIPAMRLFLKNQASFAGFIAIDPSEDDISRVSTFDYGNNLKPTMILGSFERSESINAFLDKVPDVDESNFSVVSFKNLIDEKLATGVVETFLHKIFTNKKIEPISQKDINSLSFIKGEVDVEESSDDSNDSVISNWR